VINSAEKVLEANLSKKNIKGKMVSAASRYVPSSLLEIQAGANLESAKASRISFNPDEIIEDSTKEVEHKSKPNSEPNVDVADVAFAMVF
jgi:hypothetical protein